MDEQVKQLEERVAKLENLLSHFNFSELKELNINASSIGNMQVGNGCELKISSSSIGGIFSEDVDDAEERLEDLESRIEELNGEIEELNDQIEELEDRIREAEEKLDEDED